MSLNGLDKRHFRTPRGGERLADPLRAPLATPKIQNRTQTLWRQAFWCKEALKSGNQNGNSG